MPERRKQDFVFGVDLDGVCADFIGGLRPIAARWLGKDIEKLTPEPLYGFREWGLDDDHFKYEDLHRFAVTEHDLFASLEPMEGAAQALRRLSKDGVRIRIITHRLYIPFTHKASVSQTVDWLDHNGFPYWDLCFMREKGAVGANIYVEDSPSNIAELRHMNASVIVFENSTNKDPGFDPPKATNWEEVEALVGEHFAEWSRYARYQDTRG